MENMSAKELAARLELSPHPEGGYFKETYRSVENIPPEALPERYGGTKSFATAIYFLITAETFSAMHRLKSDEVLHFYRGAPALVFMILPDGDARENVLGNDIAAGHQPQIVVPQNTWFGIRVIAPGDYTLTGTTVAPGFDYEDFELSKGNALIEQYPQHAQKISRFLRPDDASGSSP